MQDFDARIKSFEERLASTMDQLNAARQRAAQTTVAWLRANGEALAQSAVIANPDRAKALGHTGMSVLKGEIRAFLQNADAEAAVLFARVWDHSAASALVRPNKRAYLGAPERLIGRIGDILYSRELIERPPGGARSGWSTGYVSGGQTNPVTEIVYRFESVPDGISSAIDSYMGLLRLAGEQQEELERLKTTKAQAEARQLWDEAE